VRIAWFSPLPPIPSGISDYSFELLPLIAESVEVDVVCPSVGSRWRRRAPVAPGGLRVVDPAGFRAGAAAYDAVIYQLGNNPAHRFVFEEARRRPGIAVFHDFTMHHLIEWMHWGPPRRDLRGYRDVVTAELGPELGERLATLHGVDVVSEFEKFLWPLNGELARGSRAIVVHNHDAAERMREIAPGVPVTVIPHHAGSPPAEVAGVTREKARERLGLPADAFLVGHFGYITRPKQPGAVIGGFARLARRREDAVLLMVGADNSGGGLDRLISKYRVRGKVRPAGHVDLTRFYLFLKAVDAVVNLRYPSAGESSGTISRALAEGRATIVNNLGSFSEIPDGATLKVEVDGDQPEEVGAHLIRLAEDPAFRERVERAARQYALTELDAIRCRDLYLQVARSVTDEDRAPAL
jgi:glycosyltransferase involved in cell wall biosynthesis